MTTPGLLLAAGAGSRMGRPKALVRDSDGTPWLQRAVTALAGGGCAPVTVVLGAAADDARVLVPAGVAVVVADDWAAGLSASLRAGLSALADSGADAVVLTLVDLPDLSAEVVRRVLAAGADRASLTRAAYDGRPGHPVVIGRDHWADIAASVTGDQGAKPYLDAHEVTLVECGDLATGRDQDHDPDH